MVTLRDIAATLRRAERMGAEKDEPEGSRYVQLSDTLVNQIADALEEHRNVLQMVREYSAETTPDF